MMMDRSRPIIRFVGLVILWYLTIAGLVACMVGGDFSRALDPWLAAMILGGYFTGAAVITSDFVHNVRKGGKR